jgi:subtilase family serine protease
MNLIIFVIVLVMLNHVASTQRNANFLNHKGIKIGSRTNKDSTHEVVVIIKPKNLDKLKKVVDDVSYPSSPLYGHHYSRQQVSDLIINHEAINEVKKYFKQKGLTIRKESKYGNYVVVRGKIEQFENILSTTFYSIETKNTIVNRGKTYTIPSAISRHVESIFKTVQLPPPRRNRLLSAKASGPAIISFGSVTPELLNVYCKCVL